MYLSIGMIVKNEEKYLEQCLESMRPLMDELGAELIIADTGSTDNTVEIAKKFTDNVYHFDWINDFAAARNSTLEKAHGEWFMFCDADEIIQDCSEIIQFFKSGEYKKYGSATYIIRSYIDLADLNDYIDGAGYRLTVRNKDTKFVGEIHETLAMYVNPPKRLCTIADHYGYIYKDHGKITELAYQKSERNLALLFKEIEEDRARITTYTEAADCYVVIGDQLKALEYLDMGLEKIDHSKIIICNYYKSKVERLFTMERFAELCDTAKEFFDPKYNPSRTDTILSDISVGFMACYASYKLKRYDDAIFYFKKFQEAKRRHIQNKLNTPDSSFITIANNPNDLKVGYDIFFRCCYQQKEFELADEYSKKFPIENFLGDNSYIANYLNIRVEVMANVGWKRLDDLYKRLDDFGKEHLLMLTGRKIFSLGQESRNELIKKLSSLDEKPNALAGIYKDYFVKDTADQQTITDFLKKYGSEHREDLLYIMMDEHMELGPFIWRDDYKASEASYFLVEFFENSQSVVENYNLEKFTRDDLEAGISLYGWFIMQFLNKGLKISRVFEIYGNLGAIWYTMFDSSGYMPGDVKAAALVHNVTADKILGNYEEFKKDKERLVRVVKDLIPAADAYERENMSFFPQQTAAAPAPSNSPNTELRLLAMQVKQNIRSMINNGDIENSRALLREFEGICPDDPDIDLLKKEISNTLQ